MANKKKKKTPRTTRVTRSTRTVQSHSKPRNAALDSLRGLAILLMIIDHVAGVFFSVGIEPNSVRFWTRLSMPLFAVLMGFFLASSSTIHWKRLLQLLAASTAMNALYYYVYGELEILASLLVCYCAYLLVGKHLAWCFVAAYFFLQDPSRHLFDYSISLVITCVAQGVILKHYGWRIATISGLLTLPAVLFVTGTSQYSLYFILPATWLVAWGNSSPRSTAPKRTAPKRTVPGMETLGRYPLTAYLTQYFIILGAKLLFLSPAN